MVLYKAHRLSDFPPRGIARGAIELPNEPNHPQPNPEQIARDAFDKKLQQAGWVVQDKKAINFSADLGSAVREYQTDIGPVNYALFVDQKAVGISEARSDTWGQNLTTAKTSPAAAPPPS